MSIVCLHTHTHTHARAHAHTNTHMHTHEHPYRHTYTHRVYILRTFFIHYTLYDMTDLETSLVYLTHMEHPIFDEWFTGYPEIPQAISSFNQQHWQVIIEIQVFMALQYRLL